MLNPKILENILRLLATCLKETARNNRQLVGRRHQHTSGILSFRKNRHLS